MVSATGDGALFGFADNFAIVSTQRGPDQPKEWNFRKANASKKPDAECIRNCSPDPITKEYNHPTERSEEGKNMPTVGGDSDS